MKKIKYLLILFLMLFGINSVNAFDTSLKVYDYAQVLTKEEEENLKESIDSYINTHNMDMALVTVKYHNKIDTMNYADDFYDYNGFGIGPNHDGVIFVIDFTFGYTDIWMSTTGKAIRIYTDTRIDNILDSVAANKYNGYYKMFNAFIEKTNYYANQGIPSYNEYYETERSINWLMIIIISIAISTIIIAILISRNKMVKAATTASHYLVNGSVVINRRNDRFITTHTTSVRINDNSSSGSSRSYGGSSTHRSSSGRTHGGGGRRL